MVANGNTTTTTSKDKLKGQGRQEWLLDNNLACQQVCSNCEFDFHGIEDMVGSYIPPLNNFFPILYWIGTHSWECQCHAKV
jgi:hypothetical protein